jgi:hypothetical protein
VEMSAPGFKNKLKGDVEVPENSFWIRRINQGEVKLLKEEDKKEEVKNEEDKKNFKQKVEV